MGLSYISACSLNGGQLHKNFVGKLPKLLLLFQNLRKVGIICSAALVEPFGDLIDVVARVAQKRYHLLQLRQIQPDHQPVQRHLPQERLLIGNADPRHLFLQQPVLLLRQANGDADAPAHELRAHRDGSFAFLTVSAAASGGLLFSLPSTEGLRSCALASSRASLVNRSTSPLWLFTAR